MGDVEINAIRDDDPDRTKVILRQAIMDFLTLPSTDEK